MKVLVLGPGSWGTALAVMLSRAGRETTLWGRADEIAQLERDRENRRFLPGVALPGSLRLVSDLPDPTGLDLVFAVPTGAQREVARAVAAVGSPRRALSVAKGWEPETLKRMSEVLREELGDGPAIGYLAGPSHAEEVARGIPTTVTVSADSEEIARSLQELMHAPPTFRVYTNPDMLGVETAAALKNVIAIAAGICDGLGFGDNTKGALLTRGLAEISRLGVALGARTDTFFGLAGIGDLVTTAMSGHSRNRKVGELVGRGMSVEEAARETGMVAEGVKTTRSALAIAREHGVELPITEQVAAVLFEGKDPREALGELMERDAKPEVR
jgi:glycerol-3-phosphate dehydrogenase (NAD(P)+)